jgi:hypothetical protein
MHQAMRLIREHVNTPIPSLMGRLDSRHITSLRRQAKLIRCAHQIFFTITLRYESGVPLGYEPGGPLHGIGPSGEWTRPEEGMVL